MKILVPVKRVVDYNIKIRLRSDGSGVELANVKMSMNPFDEIAVEEALRQKEAGKATEVIIVSIGPQQASETIRTALAMGADRGILIKTDALVEPLTVAKLLKGVVDAEQPGLVIMGKQAIDDDFEPDRTDAGSADRLGSGHIRLQGRRRRRLRRSHARGRRRHADRVAEAAGDRHHRFALERAALRLPPQHHEGEEEADPGEGAGRLRGRRFAPAQGAENRRAPRPQVRSEGQIGSGARTKASR